MYISVFQPFPTPSVKKKSLASMTMNIKKGNNIKLKFHSLKNTYLSITRSASPLGKNFIQ